jgi:tRNA pseudouridine38-40 synthase
LGKLFAEPVKVTGAGRTDSGVHASGQVVSLVGPSHFPFDRLPPALSGLLPSDLSLREAAVVDPAFSARFSARERAYVYAVFNRPARSGLLARYAYHVPQALDLAAMRAGVEPLLGQHDFRSFTAADSEATTIREVRRLAIEPRGEVLRIEIAADGFLHHMVRTIVGTLLECGLGRRSPEELSGVLEARSRDAAGFIAPPHGLYLAGVRYRDGYDSFAEPPLLRAAERRALDGEPPFP